MNTVNTVNNCHKATL